MGTVIVEDFPYDIDERTADYLGFDLVDCNDDAIPINSAKVFIFIESVMDDPVWVNDRDGSDSTGLSIIGNKVDFEMSDDDNLVVDNQYVATGFETHLIRFELKYDGGSQTCYIHYRVKVKDLAFIGD